KKTGANQSASRASDTSSRSSAAAGVMLAWARASGAPAHRVNARAKATMAPALTAIRFPGGVCKRRCMGLHILPCVVQGYSWRVLPQLVPGFLREGAGFRFPPSRTGVGKGAGPVESPGGDHM